MPPSATGVCSTLQGQVCASTTVNVATTFPIAACASQQVRCTAMCFVVLTLVSNEILFVLKNKCINNYQRVPASVDILPNSECSYLPV